MSKTLGEPPLEPPSDDPKYAHIEKRCDEICEQLRNGCDVTDLDLWADIEALVYEYVKEETEKKDKELADWGTH